MGNEHSFLKRVYISGYKSISASNPQTIDLTNINVIIGANGSGKSNFISLFKMLNSMMKGAMQHFVGENGSSNNLLYFGAKKTPLLSVSLEFENHNDINVYNFSLMKSVQDTLIFAEENIIWNGKKYYLADGGKESCLIAEDLPLASEKFIKLVLSKCRTFQFHDTSSTALMRCNCLIDNNRCLLSDAGNIASILYLLKNNDSYIKYYKRIIQFIQSVFPNFGDFYLQPQMLNQSYIKLNWKQKDNIDYIFGPEQLSDGSIRFIALAVLFLQPPELLPNVIIIDEPELGLHPQAIDSLSSMIRIASHHSQIIMATQSPRIVDSFDADNIIVAQTDKISKSSVFKKLDETQLKDWLSDYSISELWEKNIFGGTPL